MKYFGLIFFILGGSIALINLYLSYFRSFYLIKIKKIPAENYQHISGYPLIGQFFLMIFALSLEHFPMLMWPTIVLAFIDVGGIHVIIVVLLYEFSSEFIRYLKKKVLRK